MWKLIKAFISTCILSLYEPNLTATSISESAWWNTVKATWRLTKPSELRGFYREKVHILQIKV